MSPSPIGWSGGIAYWFIPIANLFRPKQVVNDIWRASDPDLPRGVWASRDVPLLIHCWWGAWLISAFVERILFKRSVQAGDSPADFVSLSQTYIVWDLVDVVPAALAFLVVWKITARQEARRRRFERGELGLSTPAPATSEPDESSTIPTDGPPPNTVPERLGDRS